MPLLFAYGINRFSHDVAQIIIFGPPADKRDLTTKNMKI